MRPYIHWAEPDEITEEFTNGKQLRVHHSVKEEAHAGPINEGKTYLALYINRPMMALPKSQGKTIIGFDAIRDLGFNVMGEAIRGGLAQVVQPLQARVTPVGGTWEQHQACETLGRVIDGTFDFCDFTTLAGRMVADGMLCGQGFGLVEEDPITHDFSDVRLDPFNTFYNHDRTEATTLRVFSRRKAMAWWPEHKEHIKKAPQYRPEHVVEVDYADEWKGEDTVGIYMGWTETVGEDKGRFCYQLRGSGDHSIVLDEGEWPDPLPVFDFMWDHGFRDHQSKPAGRTIAPMHYWINEIVRRSYETLAGNVPWVIGSTDPQISDVPYQFVQKDDGATVSMPNLAGLQHNRNQIDDLRAQVMREVGMSEEAVHGDAPPQFKSGVAISNWREIVNKGLSQQHRGYERIHTQAARIKAAMMARVYASKQARARAMDTDRLDQIDFAALDLPENGYIIRFDVTTALPKSIAQRTELVAFLNEKGQIDDDEFLLHVNVPDFEAVAKRRSGPRKLMERQISVAINEGRLIPPSEVQDAAKLAELAGQAYQAAMAQHLKPPRKNLQALLHLYLMAKEMTPQPAATPGIGTDLGPMVGLGAAPTASLGGLPGDPTGAPVLPETPTAELPPPALPAAPGGAPVI